MIARMPGGRCRLSLATLALATLLGACAEQPPAATPAATAAAAPTAAGATSGAASAATAPAAPPLEAYDDAVLRAATALLGNAQLPAASPPGRYAVVIDPLIDGVTGAQTKTTQALGARLTTLLRERYPQFEVQRFSTASVARSPLVLIGTFTGVNAERQTTGARAAYRICLALADLKSGKLVAKGLAFARAAGVDATPLPFFRDAPAWSEDPATEGYIKTCQGTKAGDPINPFYLDRIVAAALVAEAIAAYDAGRYRDSLDIYTSALASPAGRQFRVLNGIYLANARLGRERQAQEAFAAIVDYGIEHRRLAVKFLFRPGSTAFVSDPALSRPYPSWLKTIAQRAAAVGSCLEVAGHTSASGPEPLNERLSLLRAEYVKTRLETLAPALARRLIASGMGSRQTMVGSGRDDASDALDRRVEFKLIGC